MGGKVEKATSMILELAEAYAAVGTFGLMFDLLRGPQFGLAATVGTIAGPTASDVVNITHSIFGGGNLRSFMLNQIPVLGSVLRRQRAIGRAKPTGGPRVRRRRRRGSSR